MATSSVSPANRGSLLQSSFSDQSHLFFYHTAPSRIKLPTRRSDGCSRVHLALASSTDFPDVNLSSECALLQEFRDLKTQMKQKKQQIKALKKESKKASKEEKKRKKDVKASTCGKGSSSSSESSSSESSCDEKEEMRMGKLRFLRKRQEHEVKSGLVLQEMDAEVKSCINLQERNMERLVLEERSGMDSRLSSIPEAMALQETSGLVSAESGDAVATLHGKETDGTTMAKRLSFGCSGNQLQASGSGNSCATGRIEVCVGGKCKRAGADQLLSSLKGQIPSSSGIEAAPHKCFGKCKQAINVKVLKEDTNPQYSSHASADDALLILSQHFGVPSSLNSTLPRSNVFLSPCLSPQVHAGSSAS